MEIINGVEVSDGSYILNPNIKFKTTTYTDSYTVKLTQTGETLIMNSSSNKTFTLPSVSASDMGVTFTFANINTGKLTIDAADSDIIADSATGATIYSDDDNFSQLTLELVSATRWLVKGAHGTWTTT